MWTDNSLNNLDTKDKESKPTSQTSTDVTTSGASNKDYVTGDCQVQVYNNNPNLYSITN
jgi:hypothetical protein